MIIKATSEDARKLFHEGIQTLSSASAFGMCVDVKHCKKQHRYLTKKCKHLSKQFLNTKMGKQWSKEFMSPNLNSDDQLRTILFKKNKIKAVKTTKPSKTFPKGRESVDSESLELISRSYDDLKPYMLYKKLSKVNNTFLTGILKEQVNGIIHPFFHLHIARTFRSSSSNINFHNQPNRDKQQKKIVRSCFVPRKGNHLLTADFSGIEVGTSCCYHKDKKMLKYVRNPDKNNMHTDMALQCYLLDKYDPNGEEKMLRKGAKNGLVFPQFYGDYYKNCAASLASWAELPTKGIFRKKDGRILTTGVHLGKNLIKKGIEDYDSFVDHIQDVEYDFWNNRFKGYKNWKIKNVKEYYEKGYLKTLTGFICSGEMSDNDINNYPIQGAAFHMLLKTFNEVERRLRKYKLKTRLLGQIHDELVFDCHPKETEIVLEIVRSVATEWLLKQWKWIIVPMTIEANIFEVDANWSTSANEVKLKAA